MHVAAQFSDTATMREELEAGENPNVRDYDGSTPLYLVCLFASKTRNLAATTECVRLLLRPELRDLLLGEQARDLIIISNHETKALR